MNQEIKRRRILKQFENSYYTVLLPAGDKRWGSRTIVIAN